jgi:hypothetical protein
MSTPVSETAEHLETERWLLGIAGELPPLLERHELDKRGRCSVCRAAPRWYRPWPTRTTCTVRAELCFSLRHLDRLAPSIINEHNTIRGTL